MSTPDRAVKITGASYEAGKTRCGKPRLLWAIAGYCENGGVRVIRTALPDWCKNTHHMMSLAKTIMTCFYGEADEDECLVFCDQVLKKISADPFEIRREDVSVWRKR